VAPNDRWRHLEGPLQRSSRSAAPQGDTLALYPPAWDGPREAALRTALLTESVATALRAGALLWDDDHGVLKHPYYVNHERLDAEECRLVLRWHRFGLRCRESLSTRLRREPGGYELVRARRRELMVTKVAAAA
jgi:hypothetical protein